MEFKAFFSVGVIELNEADRTPRPSRSDRKRYASCTIVFFVCDGIHRIIDVLQRRNKFKGHPFGVTCKPVFSSLWGCVRTVKHQKAGISFNPVFCIYDAGPVDRSPPASKLDYRIQNCASRLTGLHIKSILSADDIYFGVSVRVRKLNIVQGVSFPFHCDIERIFFKRRKVKLFRDCDDRILIRIGYRLFQGFLSRRFFRYRCLFRRRRFFGSHFRFLFRNLSRLFCFLRLFFHHRKLFGISRFLRRFFTQEYLLTRFLLIRNAFGVYMHGASQHGQ